jgi:hypothetical protein
MSDVVHSAVRQSRLGRLRDQGDAAPLLPLLRKEVGASGGRWLPLDLVLGAMAAVAYADHLVDSISLAYLCILPLGISAIFLRKEISHSPSLVCILLHDRYSLRRQDESQRQDDASGQHGSPVETSTRGRGLVAAPDPRSATHRCFSSPLSRSKK